MLPTRLLPVFQILIVVGFVAAPARAQTPDLRGELGLLSFGGSLGDALVAADDHVAGDRSQFLLELIRRTYNTPLHIKNVKRDSVLQSVLAFLDPTKRPGASAESSTTLPLPMPEAVWIDVVFGGRSSPATLARDIVQSRGASLFYYGALSLDNDTRAWLAAQPNLVTLIVTQYPASFAAAAPALRVLDGRVRVPGGESAEAGWEAIVGGRVADPVGFVRALLPASEGRLANWFGATALLTPGQIETLLSLDVSEASQRTAAVRRLHAIFERVGAGWRVEERAFWRPAIDPLLLVGDLPADDRGRPVVPGTAKFWNAVFDPDDYSPSKSENGGRGPAAAEPLTFTSLCEQVFTGDRLSDRRRYQLVLFASRVVKSPTSDAIETVRAAGSHPALIAALERAGLDDVAAYAQAARRAVALSEIGDDDRGLRALTQFQAAVAMLSRAAVRGALAPDALARLVTSLAALELTNRGDYEGKIVTWLDEVFRAASKPPQPLALVSGPMESDALSFVAGPVGDVRFVEWEGTRYRIDFSRAEAVRMAKLLGEQARPFLTSARTLLAVADAVAATGGTREQLQRELSRVKEVGAAAALDTAAAWTHESAPKRYKETVAGLQRAATGGDRSAAPRLVEALRLLADDLAARGLKEIVYAVALGQPERTTIAAGDAAERHDFSMRLSYRRVAPWNLPVVGADPWRGWHVVGSILGLDVQLADFAQQRVSMRPPKSKPTLDDDQRRLLIETIAIVAPARLTDADRDAIAESMKKGRARLAAVRTSADAMAVADEIRLSPARRTLLSWVAANDRERLAAFLGPGELLWLGLEKAPVARSLHAWGAPAEPRLGCLCLQLLDRRPWEIFAGRWQSGILSSAFPDLNLRLAEMLAQLQMPGALLASVLTAATPDLAEISTPRDHDDRRALVEAVQAMKIERLEQYLALLTSDGPLVPVDTSAGAAVGAPPQGEARPGEVGR